MEKSFNRIVFSGNVYINRRLLKYNPKLNNKKRDNNEFIRESSRFTERAGIKLSLYDSCSSFSERKLRNDILGFLKNGMETICEFIL